eukprot:CAMPEP_0174375490 /NCGR_PEP_ID=MMETSP0811_2-20130205/114815_1 /TAXON_ID=73025 ORGANISM="Eutreptiella gymnastica-like, Strain CCMP1594" /NCGR_SAMPLE_ID=MMETSP0811_2 /ASSEMBLY_ACC=CAM_ASM_000667 /LENGTH=92 /DNA_ID=CAMNT_0015525789 /DNA_START=1265 /DNA_END=1539 /DNA_ORIENTATION=-
MRRQRMGSGPVDHNAWSTTGGQGSQRVGPRPTGVVGVPNGRWAMTQRRGVVVSRRKRPDPRDAAPCGMGPHTQSRRATALRSTAAGGLDWAV